MEERQASQGEVVIIISVLVKKTTRRWAGLRWMAALVSRRGRGTCRRLKDRPGRVAKPLRIVANARWNATA